MQATDKVIQKTKTKTKTKYSKKIENPKYNYRMTAKKPISISRHKISDQKWENHFPEGIFPWNLAHN